VADGALKKRSSIMNYVATIIRENAQRLGVGQEPQPPEETQADIAMGFAGGSVGRWLASSDGSIQQFGSFVANYLGIGGYAPPPVYYTSFP
jgi:hypothetical protein